VLAAETPSDQSPIQSLRPEGTVPSVGSKVDALPSNIPNDSYFNKQWALQKMQGCQTKSGGPEVLIAVLDTGIDTKHEDLAGKVVKSVSFTKSATASDALGHGTHIAGIIAATANNGIGIAGFAPNARLLNVKIADDNGMVWPSTIAEGIIWAVDNGARIINMSLAVPSSTPALEEAVAYASSKGVVLIAAAGNNIKSIPVYPAYYSNVIAVAATDSDGRLWAESNNGDWVDVYAPGVEIFSTNPGNSYSYLSGTSMATAYATAAAALMFDTVTDVNDDGSVSDEVAAQLKAFFGDLE
jgi:thermitase